MPSLAESAHKILLLTTYEDDDVYWGMDTSFDKEETDEKIKEWADEIIGDLTNHLRGNLTMREVEENAELGEPDCMMIMKVRKYLQGET